MTSTAAVVVYPLNARVKFAFDAGDDNQISLVAGTLVKVHNQTNDDWWDVEYNNNRGYAPASYLDVLPPQPKKPSPPPAPAKAKAAPPAAGRAAVVATNNRKVETRDVLGLGMTSSTTSDISSDSNTNGAVGVRARVLALKQPLLASNDDDTTSIHIDDEKGAFTENKQPLLDSSLLVSDRPARSGGKADSKPDIRLPAGNFASLAENMGLYSSYSLLILGPTAIVMSAIAPVNGGTRDALIGLYGAILGALMYLYESRVKLTARDLACFRRRFPFHAAIYFLLALPLFVAKGTILAAVFIFVQTAVNIISAVLGETAAVRNVNASATTHDDDDDDDNDGKCWTRCQSWLFQKQAENKIRISVFLVLYVTSNVIIFFVVLRDWIAINNSLLARNRLSSWAPWAKAFGNLLDYNCVLVLMPVCRTFLRLLYNRATRDKRLTSRILHYILSFTPLDHNIGSHKFLAKMITFASVGHTVMHLVNYALRPDQTIAKFGYWSILSGGAICVIMFIMYAAAAENVKRGNFELFWYVHHLFVVFFILLLLHGQGGWNPNFWKWLLLPGAVYILERTARVYRSRQAVTLISVTHMRSANGSNVLCLELSSSLFQYAEGQYLFLNCPSISGSQWHPFTISSAPQEDYLTLHIRVMGPGSWTRRLQDYLETMGPVGATHYTLSHIDAAGVNQVGKLVGPDNVPLFRADGPHSAPTQHITRYSTVLVAGAGIGVTPLAAALKSIVFHRWKYFIGKSYPDNAHFVWSLSWAEIDTFRWLIRVIKDVQDELVDARAKHGDSMNNKIFDFHIYISSVPKDVEVHPIIIDNTPEFWGLKQEATHTLERKTASWSREDLYKLVKNPNRGPTKLGDITVWSGRPNWDDRFTAIAARHPTADIGVLFCGNAFIGQDLSDACAKHSSPQSGGPMFRLHKENF